MGGITPYESAKGHRYDVRYRKPDRTETEKRGFTTMSEARLCLSMVTMSKSRGEYIDPSSSRVPVGMFADSWLRSKQPPMSKPSYYMALERVRINHVALVLADRHPRRRDRRSSRCQRSGPPCTQPSPARPGKRRLYLSHDQVATLAACSAYPTLVLTLAYTGLRWGEGRATGAQREAAASGAWSSRRTR